MDELKTIVPQGLEYSDPVRHDDLRRGVDPRGLQDAVRGRGAGAGRHPGLPPGLAGRLVPATTVPVTIIGAFAAMAAARLLDQHAHAVRPGAGHRHRRRRRDRDRRERRRTTSTTTGSPPKEATIKAMSRGDRAGHRHHPGAHGRVPADRLPRRDHRPALPPVRPDHRRHGRHQRHQRRDAQAGPVRHLPAAQPRAPERLLPRLQRRLRPRRGRLRRRSSRAWCAHTWLAMLVVRRARRAHRLVVHAAAHGFLPTEDQGYAIVGIQLPDAASQERTRAVVEPRSRRSSRRPRASRSWVMIGGLSVLDQANASNAALLYVRWTPYDERTVPELSQEAILAQAPRPVPGDPGGDRLHLPAAGHPGPGRGRRLPDAARGPRRRGLDRAPAGDRRDDRRRDRPDQPEVAEHARSAPACRSSTPTSTGSRPRAWTCRSTWSSARSRRPSARPTSTTSTSSAGPTRSGCRPTSGSGSSPRTSAGSRSATCKAR